MLKSLRKTAALSLVAVPLILGFSGVAQAEEIRVYTSLTDNYDVYIDPATIIFSGNIREFVQKNVPREGRMVAILQRSVNCSTGEIATRNTRRENLEGTSSRSSSRVGQFRRPKAGVEDFLVDLICRLEQPEAGTGSIQVLPQATQSRTSGVAPGYSTASMADPPICYMQDNQGQMFDLTSLCGLVASPGSSGSSSFGAGGYSGGNFSSSGSGSGSGVCNVPSDRDARGNRCGGRAASERAGGR
jgi:hypothetical protein